jgi:CheY-like chemotaxis protein
MHSRIFDRFVQVETELSKLTGGTGLGLSISKSLIELLGGKIWLKSDSGKGTTFYFTIPYKKFEEKIIIKKPVLPQIINDEKKHTILVAEDEEANFVFLEILLKNMFKNTIILHARNGQEAINSVIQFPEISLILMDLKMPEMNGYTATIEIKKINPDIIIIAQTAYALSSDELKAKEVGCDNYIPKPINKNNLFELLSKYLY